MRTPLGAPPRIARAQTAAHVTAQRTFRREIIADHELYACVRTSERERRHALESCPALVEELRVKLVVPIGDVLGPKVPRGPRVCRLAQRPPSFLITEEQ